MHTVHDCPCGVPVDVCGCQLHHQQLTYASASTRAWCVWCTPSTHPQLCDCSGTDCAITLTLFLMQGSLRTALDQKLLIDRTTGLAALECVLFLAHDVACALIHLHSEHLLHGDLKASNVLLKRTAPRLPLSPEQQPAAGRAETRPQQQSGQRNRPACSLIGQGFGLMAKVADFGLSLTLGPSDTHVSQMHMVSTWLLMCS